MEIRELNLAAFGPFTGRTLIFDPGAGGLHIVFGPNEAGKSSALRGLKALLYGVDERTADDFIHAKDKLRIAGCVRDSKGNKMAFSRRKGRKNTLISPDGEPLDENALAPFLQGVSAEVFQTLFGIDHEALVQGGREILEQKGEVGQALFSASLGSHTLHALLGRLDEDADGLFRPRGATQTINSALKVYTGLKKETKDRSLPSREWDEHRKLLARTNHESEQIQTELSARRVELNRLKRIQRMLPKLASRRELRHRIETLGEVVVLPDDFGNRRQKAVADLETARVVLQKATGRLDSLQSQREQLPIRRDVLEQSESIENLHDRLGGHRKAMQDRPHLDAEYKQLLKDVESLLRDVRPDIALPDVAVLRPVFAKRQQITELGSQNSVLVSRTQDTKKNSRDTEARLRDARNECEKLPVVVPAESLRRAVAAATKSGDLDQAIDTARREVTILREQCATGLARLNLWTGSFAEIGRLPVPDREGINRFEVLYADLEKRTQRLREKQEENTGALHEALQRMEELRLAGAVPTEDELIQARAERGRVWQLLRRQWLNGEDIRREASDIDPGRPLPDAFEDRMIRADDLADRLRREADRVHARAGWLAEQENAKRRAAKIEQQLDESAVEKKQADKEWEALWAPCEIKPRSPREMRAWLDRLETLRARVEELINLQERVVHLENGRDTAIQSLKQQLRSIGKGCPETDSLEIVLNRSEDVVDELEGIKRQREILDQEIKSLERNLESAVMDHQSAQKNLGEWLEKWKSSVAVLGLEGDALPSEAADVIEKLRQMFAKLGEAEKLQIRIQSIDLDAETFLAEVGRAIADIAPELAGQPVHDAVIRLNTLLLESRTRQSRREQIEEQQQQARAEIQDSGAQIRAMTERLNGLCREAGCDSHAELEEAERRSTEFLRLRAEADILDKEILSTGEGATLVELESEAGAVDPDTIPAMIKDLANHIEGELEPRRMALAEAKGRAAKEIELMDGSDQAAVLADRGQSVLAGIRSHAERYVRLKLAARILRDQIERYRRENQGPMLQRASDHFVVLTCGSFAGLKADMNEKDQPVLVGIRPNHERVQVEGMSSGTRDQLYLALRLASLEKYMESSEALPFIVDDILVDFDDERSKSALNALAGLAEKTQVILFTHHSRVVEQARKLRTQVVVQVHPL